MKRLFRIFNVLAFTILLLTFFSCSTYEPIQIQVLKPAYVKISKDINKVILINYAVYNKSSFTNKTGVTKQFENIDSIRTNEYFNGLNNVLNNSPRFEIENDNPIFLSKLNYNERFKSLDWLTIEKLCNDSNADAAIVLESFQVLYSSKVPIFYNEDKGRLQGTLELDNSSLWKIYIPSQHKVEDNFLLLDTLFWDGFGDYDYQVLGQLPDINDAILQSCYYAGEKYGERIAQTWETKKRYLIYCNNKDFITAYNLATQDKWEDAIELWRKFPYGKRKRLAAFASYNLAVASETLDHIDLALEWASKSYLLNKNPFVENYIKILEKRKSEIDIVEKQFN